MPESSGIVEKVPTVAIVGASIAGVAFACVIVFIVFSGKVQARKKKG